MTNKLINISMIGRISYAIQCIEKYFLSKYPNKDFSSLSVEMWKVTSSYFDNWNNNFLEIIPEYLFEFDGNYKENAYDYLSKDTFFMWIDFYKEIQKDKNINTLLMSLSNFSTIYAYMPIPQKGKESLKIISNIEQILITNNVELPSPDTFAFTPFTEKNGWGNQFDGTKYSLILKKNI